jgi:hypothetical protein
MPLPTETIVCDVTLATGAEFEAGRASIVFKLDKPDWDTVANEAIPANELRFPLDEDGQATVTLWPNDRGNVGSVYQVWVEEASSQFGRGIVQPTKYPVIRVVDGGGPYNLTALFDLTAPPAPFRVVSFLTQAEYDAAIAAGQQAAASAASAALSSAAAGVASGRLEIVADSQLSEFVYSAPDEGERLAAAGDVIVNRTNGAAYRVLASGGDTDRPDVTGVKLEALPNSSGEVTFVQLGAVGDGAANDTAAMQRAMHISAARGVWAVSDAGKSFRATSQLIARSGMKLRIEGDILRDWTHPNNDKVIGATIKNENAWTQAQMVAANPGPFIGTYDEDITITGTGEIRLHPTTLAIIEALTINSTTGQRPQTAFAGPHISMIGVRNYVEGPITLRGPCNNWTTTYLTFGHRINGLSIRDQVAIFEDGYHIWGGDNISGELGYIEAGDDCFAIANNTNHSALNIDVSMPQGYSHRAFLAKVDIRRIGATASYPPSTAKVEDVTIFVKGKGGQLVNGGFYIDDPEGVCDRVDLECWQQNADADDHIAGAAGAERAHAGIVAGPGLAAVGKSTGLRVKLRTDRPIRHALRLTNLPSRIDVDVISGPSQDQDSVVYEPIWMQNCADVWANLDVECTTGPGVRTFNSNARLRGTIRNVPADAPEVPAVRTTGGLVDVCDLQLPGAAANAMLIESRTETTRVIFGGTTRYNGTRAVAALGAAGVNHLRIGGDDLVQTTAIAAGSITLHGAAVLRVLSRNDLSDSLSFITNTFGVPYVVVMNGEADPATKTISLTTTGNLSVGSTRVLNTATARIRLRWDPFASVWLYP